MAPSSTGPPSDNETDKATPVSNENRASVPPVGSGGGLGGVIVPLGVYVIREDKVVWKPVVQPMLLALLALSLVRLITKHALN